MARSTPGVGNPDARLGVHRNRQPVEKHHLLNPQAWWRVWPVLKSLRENRWLIPPLDGEAHGTLHDAVSGVPPLDYHLARAVLADYVPVRDDYVGSLDSLVGSIDRASRGPKVDHIQRSVARVAMYGLESQRPFVVEGLVVPDTRTIIDLKAA